MSPYPPQPLQYPQQGPPQRSAPSPSYTSHRVPLMSQYATGHQPGPAQYPPGHGPANPAQYFKVSRIKQGFQISSDTVP